MRGWVDGWPARPWAKPISLLLENEKIEAAAAARVEQMRAAEAAEAIREAARLEGIEAQKQEHQILKAARGDVLAVLVMAAELVPSMRSLGKIIAEAVKPDATGALPKIAPSVAMGLLSRHAQIVQKAVGAAEAVIQLSRLDRGETTANVGVTLGIPDEEISEEDALAELEAIEGVLQGAKHAGLLAGGGVVRPGGSRMLGVGR